MRRLRGTLGTSQRSIIGTSWALMTTKAVTAEM